MTTTPQQPITPEIRANIHKMMAEFFSLDELKSLFFEFDFDHENVKGTTKDALTISFIQHLDNRKQLPRLLTKLQEERPFINWDKRPPQNLPCPYRGLSAFREEDAGLFFGRETYTNRILKAVEEQSFVAVVGPSGSGKSSIVFAGVLAQLRSRETWQIASFRPGNRPFYNLASTLVGLDGEIASRAWRLDETNQMTKALSREEDPLPLADVLQDHLQSGNENSQLLLIVDQFEELYTLAPDAEVRRRFSDALLSGIAVKGVTVLITLRADFLGQALGYRPFADVLQDNDIKLGPMNREELNQAVVYPAQNTNLQFEAGLVETILREIGDEPGNLPLLQFALTELWGKQINGMMTHDAYSEIGRVDGALAYYADQQYEKLDEEAQAQARRIFIQLVQPGEGTEDTRRLALRSELSETDWPLVQQLASQRLVVTGQDDDNQETVEVVHEALIRRWGQLQTWMTEDRKFRAWQERLRHNLRQWVESDQDKDALLRGVPAAEANNFLKTNGADLGKAEKAFIDKSLAESKKRERLRQLVFAGIAIAANSFAFLSYFLIQALEDANKQVRIDQARLLGSQASNVLESDFKTGLLRAVQSVNLTYEQNQIVTAEAYNALHSSLTIGSQSVPLGHTAGVWMAEFSPSGEYIVTASDDGTARVWDKEGQLFSTLERHSALVRTAVFSPDSQQIVTASRDSTARIWTIDGKLVTTLKGHTESVLMASFSPDNRHIVTASLDGTAILWDRDGQLVTTLKGHTEGVLMASFSPDNRHIVTASLDGTAIVWNREGQLVTTLIGHTDIVFTAEFSPNSQHIVTTSRDKTASVWTLDGNLVSTLEGHSDSVLTAEFSPDNQQIVTASWDGTARLWNKDGQLLTSFEKHSSIVRTARFSPNGQQIVTASDDGTAIVWEQNGWIVKTLVGHTAGLLMAEFSPNGQQIVTASYDNQQIVTTSNDGTARLWGHANSVITVLESPTTKVAFSPDNQLFVTAGGDKMIRVWNRDGQLVTTFEGPTFDVSTIKFRPDSQQFVTVFHDGTAQIRNRKGQLLESFSNLLAAEFSPDNQQFVAVYYDGTARVWDKDWQLVTILKEEHTADIRTASFSPDSQQIITTSAEIIRLWNRDGQFLTSLDGHNAGVRTVAFSPDNQLIVSVSAIGRARIWNKDGQLLTLLEGHTGGIRTATFSPDSQLILTASDDSTARLWNRNGQLLTTIEGHSAGVMKAEFSPDGQQIMTLSNTIRLWDKDGRLMTTMENPSSSYQTAFFSPDGMQILTVGQDTQLWEISIETLILEGKRILFPMLTLEECQELFPEECPFDAAQIPIP